MKEKFFYLEQKYPGTKLIINNRFGVKGNLYSVYVAREHLQNTYLCYADHYFITNPFLNDNPDNISYHACSYKEGKFGEFSVDYSDADVITGVNIGGKSQMSMVGQAYFNEGFSNRLRGLMETEIKDFRISSLFWEEFFQRHHKQLTLYIQKYKEGDTFCYLQTKWGEIVEIPAALGGKLVDISVKPGQQIRQGDTIAWIEREQ